MADHRVGALVAELPAGPSCLLGKSQSASPRFRQRQWPVRLTARMIAADDASPPVVRDKMLTTRILRRWAREVR